jgi:hypothetical protein
MPPFIANESKIHLDAKMKVCEMYNKCGNGFSALVEVPLIKYKEADNFTWTNTWTGKAWWNQADVPDFKQCKYRYNTEYGPFKVVDVAVYQYSRLKCLIEILKTNPVRDDQIERIRKEGLVLYEVSADDVLAMEEADTKLSAIWKRLC